MAQTIQLPQSRAHNLNKNIPAGIPTGNRPKYGSQVTVALKVFVKYGALRKRQTKQKSLDSNPHSLQSNVPDALASTLACAASLKARRSPQIRKNGVTSSTPDQRQGASSLSDTGSYHLFLSRFLDLCGDRSGQPAQFSFSSVLCDTGRLCRATKNVAVLLTGTNSAKLEAQTDAMDTQVSGCHMPTIEHLRRDLDRL